MPPWFPEPGVWAGRTVAILAGGPSLTPAGADAVREHTRIAINDSWRLAPDANVLFAADLDWWRRHPEALSFAGLKLCAQSARLPGVFYWKPMLVGGGNSALHAAYVARAAGAARLLLLGVDLDARRLTHWHGRHPDGLRNPTVAGFNAALAAWRRFAELPARPDVINCNPDSALDCFERLPIEDIA